MAAMPAAPARATAGALSTVIPPIATIGRDVRRHASDNSSSVVRRCPGSFEAVRNSVPKIEIIEAAGPRHHRCFIRAMNRSANQGSCRKQRPNGHGVDRVRSQVDAVRPASQGHIRAIAHDDLRTRAADRPNASTNECGQLTRLQVALANLNQINTRARRRRNQLHQSISGIVICRGG